MARTYIFGPLEKRGVLAGLRSGQIIIVGVGLLLALIVFSSGVGAAASLPLALVVMAGAVVLTYIQPGGRGIDEWAPVLFRWFLGSAGNKNRQWFSTMPLLGNYEPEGNRSRVDLSENARGRGPEGKGSPKQKRPMKTKKQANALPPSLQGLSILEVPVGDGPTTIGVIKDERAGLYTGVLSVRGDAFSLLEQSEKERRLQAWADVLGSMARNSSFVHRVQWVERAVPDDGDAFNRYLTEAKVQPDHAPTVRSYIDLLQEFGPIAQQHETYVALQISAQASGRVIKKAGGGDKGACLVLIRELRQLIEGLNAADVKVDGALSPRLLSATFRNAVDPDGRRDLVKKSRTDPKRAGVNPSGAWPIATETKWDHYKTERAYHATYWISEWPRLEVGPDFMAPLMVRTQRIRTVSMIMQPIDPQKAQREVESAHTAYVSDEELRGRAGYMPNERRRRELEGVLRREQELADGFAEYRFAGYITVTGNSEEDLEEACSEIEQAAQQARLDLRRLFGEQDLAFTCTLPLCRGLS